MRTVSRHSGFSLVELLIVIALVAIMTALAVPAFVSIAQGQGMKRAINSTSDLLEIARSEAMAKSTWTWVGIVDSTSSNAAKSAEILIAGVISRDGTSNTATANLSTLAKPLRIADVTVLTTATPWSSNATVVKNSSYQFSATVNGQAQTFSGAVVAFSPQGEALITPSSVSRWLEIGLREMRGTTPMTNKTASLRISGVSGQVVVDY